MTWVAIRSGPNRRGAKRCCQKRLTVRTAIRGLYSRTSHVSSLWSWHWAQQSAWSSMTWVAIRSGPNRRGAKRCCQERLTMRTAIRGLYSRTSHGSYLWSWHWAHSIHNPRNNQLIVEDLKDTMLCFKDVDRIELVTVAAVSGVNQRKTYQLRLEIRFGAQLGFFLLVHERRGVWAREMSRPRG